jgi:hypothetical protein
MASLSGLQGSTAASDAWSSFSTSRAALLSELGTVRALVYKNQSQHRRTRYWQALRRAQREASRLAAAVGALCEGDFLQAAAGAGRGAGGVDAGVVTAGRLHAVAGRCTACAAAATLHAHTLTARQTGAGFAALLAVLVGSVAQFVYLALRMRDACRAVLQ